MTYIHNISRRSREHFEVYLTRVNPDDADLSLTDEFPIEKNEWLNYVEEDDDLIHLPDKNKQDLSGIVEAWGLQSHPEGAPLYYSQGAIYIDRDDTITINKMTKIAVLLNAFVISENGEVFSIDKVKTATTSSQRFNSSSRQPKVKLEDERIRQRQCLFVIVLCLIFPALVSYWWITEFIGPIHIIGAVASLIFGGWVLHLCYTPKHYIEKDFFSNKWIVHYRSTSSTDAQMAIGELNAHELPGLELVWFVQDYPAKTVIEFHVRAVNQPWLVLFATRNELKAIAFLKSSATKLVLKSHDRTNEQPATDIPKRYLLKPEEKKSASVKGQLFITILMIGFAALLYFQVGIIIFPAILFVLASMIPIGLLVSHFWSPSIPEKYRLKLSKSAKINRRNK